MKITFIFSCSGMFRDVPGCSGMFRVPGFIDGLWMAVFVLKSHLDAFNFWDFKSTGVKTGRIKVDDNNEKKVF